MDHILYRKAILPVTVSPSGHPEEPTEVVVTKEANCFLVWFLSPDCRRCLAAEVFGYGTPDPSRMIDRAMELAREGVKHLEVSGLPA